ncbi:DUF4981 domain-containing protein [Zeaxanthinibacter sp. PT1]|uniref:beta-galactosidase small subunit family protein n=1 Tax=Zeaxanthinibacter TaxID=561554 RepID=UPI00234B7A42|nr:beta-galactosidase domain 4-containing protein [Zeaxanthinibacter sp. PT1]MDC6350055.1 DUF4981 domain-containing protein [Zeaxanthinibacter sp. PT1]
MGGGIIEVDNKNYFADLSDKQLNITVLKNGAEIFRESENVLNIDPRQSRIITIANFPSIYDLGNEYILELSLVQKLKTSLMPAGYEVAWDQFVLQKGALGSPPAVVGSKMALKQSGKTLVLANKTVKLEIDARSGEIINWTFMGKKITGQPIRPNFWRPPTDNDLGNNMHHWAKIWQEASYNYSARLIAEPSVSNTGIEFRVAYTLPNNEAEVTVNYKIYPTGRLEINYLFKPNHEPLPLIPRLGMYMTLPGDFKEVSWYGKGPGESYWDRKTGLKTGIFKGKVEDQFHRYMRPQETGNKTEVRWMYLSSKTMNLLLQGNVFLNSSVWPFGMKEIDINSEQAGVSASGLVPVTKRHGADIKLWETVQWNIDLLQMGVGGDNSWGSMVHDEYTIRPMTYGYKFSIEPTLR